MFSHTYTNFFHHTHLASFSHHPLSPDDPFLPSNSICSLHILLLSNITLSLLSQHPVPRCSSCQHCPQSSCDVSESHWLHSVCLNKQFWCVLKCVTYICYDAIDSDLSRHISKVNICDINASMAYLVGECCPKHVGIWSKNEIGDSYQVSWILYYTVSWLVLLFTAEKTWFGAKNLQEECA